MRYLVIGLGIYGSNLAVDLTAMGHEVIGADIRPAIVEAIKDSISTAYTLDAIDEASLRMLPLRGIDLAVVAIGENFGASVRCVALLKRLGVAHIYARAIDTLHQQILEGFGVDRIITPEQRAARSLVWEMELGTGVEAMQLAQDHYVMRFRAPAFLVGMAYASPTLLADCRLTLVAASRCADTTNEVGMTVRRATMLDLKAEALTVGPADILTVAGTRRGFRDLCRHINP